MATHSSILALRIPETEEPGGLLSMGSHRVGHDWSDLTSAAAAANDNPYFPIYPSPQVKESTCQDRRCRRYGFDPWVGKIPWSRKWKLTPVLLPGKFHGQGSLEGCSPWGHKELYTTEHTHAHVQDWSLNKIFKASSYPFFTLWLTFWITGHNWSYTLLRDKVRLTIKYWANTQTK